MAEAFRFIENCEIIIAKRLEKQSTKAIYEETNRQIEKMCEMLYLIMVNISVPSIMFPKCLISFYTYFISDLGNDSFVMPFDVWYPFDWRNLAGYSVAFTGQYLVVLYAARVATCITSFVAGTFWLLISLAKDIKGKLYIVYEVILNKGNLPEVMDNLSELVELHSSVKQIIRIFVEAYELIFTFYFLWSIITISGTLLMIKMEISQAAMNPMVIMFLFCEVFWSFAFIFFFCEFGERVTNGFEEINDMIYELEWCTFPIEIQRLLPMIIIAIQKPVIINGFGNIACIRIVFKNVVSGAFSYFRVLQQFGK